MKHGTKIMLAGLLAWLAVAQIGWAYYNPETGRWLNRDPIEEDGGPNLYAACRNDAVGRIDPVGKADAAVGGGWGDTPGVGEAKGLDGCLDECDKLLKNNCLIPLSGPKAKLKSCYCYCWKQFPPTPRSKTKEQLIAEWEKVSGKPWPRCPEPDGPYADAHHKTPLADGGADDISNIEPVCPDEHKKLHKKSGDSSRWGKRKGRTCKPSDLLDQE